MAASHGTRSDSFPLGQFNSPPWHSFARGLGVSSFRSYRLLYFSPPTPSSAGGCIAPQPYKHGERRAVRRQCYNGTFGYKEAEMAWWMRGIRHQKYDNRTDSLNSKSR